MFKLLSSNIVYNWQIYRGTDRSGKIQFVTDDKNNDNICNERVSDI